MEMRNCTSRGNIEQPCTFVLRLRALYFLNIGVRRIASCSRFLDRRQKQLGLSAGVDVFEPQKQTPIVPSRAPAKSRYDHRIEFQSLRLVYREKLELLIGFRVGACEQTGDIFEEFPGI